MRWSLKGVNFITKLDYITKSLQKFLQRFFQKFTKARSAVVIFCLVVWIVVLNLKWRSILNTTIAIPTYGRIFKHSSPIIEASSAEERNLMSRPTYMRYVHQSAQMTEIPTRFEKQSATWKQCFPKAKCILWTEKDNRNFIAKNYEWFIDHYDTLPHPSDRSHAARYIYMFHFGGLYTDLDNECLRPFDHMLLNATIVLGSMDGYKNVAEGYVENSFMYSVPRHQFWLDVLHLILTDKRQHTVGHYAGSGILAEAVNLYRSKHPNSKDITVYPARLFNPFSWQLKEYKVCKDFNQMSDKELKLCRDSFRKTSYVVQYHAHTW